MRRPRDLLHGDAEYERNAEREKEPNCHDTNCVRAAILARTQEYPNGRSRGDYESFSSTSTRIKLLFYIIRLLTFVKREPPPPPFLTAVLIQHLFLLNISYLHSRSSSRPALTLLESIFLQHISDILYSKYKSAG